MNNMLKRRTLLGMGLALVVSLAPTFEAAQAQTKDLVIFAAASMKNALDEVMKIVGLRLKEALA